MQIRNALLGSQEVSRMDEYLAIVDPPVRPTLEADPDEYARLHAVNGCRTWRREVGTVIGGADFSPAMILASRTTRERDCGCLCDRDSGITIQPCARHADPKVRKAERRAEAIWADWR